MRFRRSGTRKTLAMASKNLFMDLLVLPGDSPTTTALPPAASIFSLAEPEKLWAVIVIARVSSPVPRIFRPALSFFTTPSCFERIEVEGVAFEFVQPVQIDDGVFLAEDVGEAALRQAAVHRHLAAFKSAHLRVTRNRPCALVAAPGRLAAAAAHTAADPLLRPILSFRRFEIT